eukprot:jgi/Astpho2/8277/fgenesh1_pg.00122_%23_46_t
MFATGCATLLTGAAAGALRARYHQQHQRQLQLQQENLRLANELQSAHSQVGDLEAVVRQTEQLLRQKQDASGEHAIALREQQARWGRLMDKAQSMLDVANPHGSDTQFLSRVMATARTRSVEALLEEQAMVFPPTYMLELLWKQYVMNEVDWVALAESPKAAGKQLRHVFTFEEWLGDGPERLYTLQRQWGAFETMRHVGPQLCWAFPIRLQAMASSAMTCCFCFAGSPNLAAGAMSASDMILESDLLMLDLEQLMAAAPAPPAPLADQVVDGWDAQLVGPADHAADGWEVDLVGTAEQQAADGWEVKLGAADQAAEDFEAEILAAAAALPELAVELAADELEAEVLGAAAALPALAMAMAAEERDHLLDRERDARLLAVQLQDLAIKQAIRLAAHGQCLTAGEATQQQTIMQQIQVVAAGAGVPAFLIRQLDAVAVVQQQAADAHIKQLADGVHIQQKAAAALAAQIVAGALQQVEEARIQQQAAAVVATEQERLMNELAQAQRERAQAESWLAAARNSGRRMVALTREQRERAAARVRELEAELAQEQAYVQHLEDSVARKQAVHVVDPLARRLTAVLMVQRGRTVQALQAGVAHAKRLGSGSYSAVFLCWVEGFGAVVLKRSLTNPDAIRVEASTNRRIPPNPYIAQSYGLTHVAGTGYMMLMEHLDGTLDTVPRQSDGSVGKADIQQMLHDVASGLHHLHGANLVPCDLKPNNIGWYHRKKNGQSVRCIFKVIDFGNSVAKNSEANIVGGLCAPYMTPEMALKIADEPYPFPADITFPADPARDVWALGATALEMAAQNAWVDRALIHHDWGVGRVAQEMRLDLLLAQAGDGLNITWTDVEAELGTTVTGVVKRCLSLLPSDRPTMAQVASEMAPLVMPDLV